MRLDSINNLSSRNKRLQGCLIQSVALRRLAIISYPLLK